jgi:hypothetical protein
LRLDLDDVFDATARDGLPTVIDADGGHRRAKSQHAGHGTIALKKE